MSKNQTSQQENKSNFGEMAKKCKTDEQKIAFFDSSKRAFFTESNESTFSVNENIPKDLDDAFYVYANMKKLSESELDELKNLNWGAYPKNLKIFLFDFCILNGDVYSKYFHD